MEVVKYWISLQSMWHALRTPRSWGKWLYDSQFIDKERGERERELESRQTMRLRMRNEKIPTKITWVRQHGALRVRGGDVTCININQLRGRPAGTVNKNAAADIECDCGRILRGRAETPLAYPQI